MSAKTYVMGSRIPVILVHGWNSHPGIWNPLVVDRIREYLAGAVGRTREAPLNERRTGFEGIAPVRLP